MKINGRLLADQMQIGLAQSAQDLKNRSITPKIAIITLGEEESWSTYVGAKLRLAEKIGINAELINLKNSDEKTLLETIEKLNNDPNCNGLIVQRPFPQKYDREKIIYAIQKEKDIDGFRKDSPFQVPVWLAVEEIITHIEKLLDATEIHNSPIRQAICVIGKGETAGKPIINGLGKIGLHPKVVDSSTKDRKEILKKSKIIISAVGKENVIDPESITQGVILIGVGIHRNSDGKLAGDYDETQIEHIASFYTPTPGGIGPLNLAYLFQNLLSAASIQNNFS